MANMTDQTRVNAVLNMLNAASGAQTVTFTAPSKLRLMGTMGSNTSNGTELSMTGYTAGGSACIMSAASAGSQSGPSAGNGAVSWTNSSGSTASIAGIELWDSAATPLRWFQGAWSGGTIALNNLNTLTVAVNGITLNASAW